MEPHLIELPRKILVGKGVIEMVKETCDSLGLKGRPLVLSGRSTFEIAGKAVVEQFRDAMSESVDEASVKEAERIKGSVSDMPSFVIAVGGGKVIDIGKVVSSELNIPLVSVPTAPSHDGIVSERGSIKKGGAKHSIRARPPVAVLADIGILMKSPKRMISSGAADVISNCSAVNDWRLARNSGEYYSDYAADLALMSAEIVMRSARSIREGTERGIRNLMEALISSGICMSLAGTSSPASGSEHMFSHALDALGSRALHGDQCGVGCIIMSYLQDRGWKMVRDALKEVGAPTTAKELGIPQDMIIQALLDANGVRKRHTILDERPMTRELAIKACKATGVFD